MSISETLAKLLHDHSLDHNQYAILSYFMMDFIIFHTFLTLMWYE